MIIQGIVPGPNVATEQPALFWGIIASMWIGNLMLIDPQPAADRALGEAADDPYYVLFPIIMAFCSIGVYSVNSNVYDLYAVAFFGFLGYVLTKLRCEPAPLLLGFVLGPLLEENLRRARDHPKAGGAGRTPAAHPHDEERGARPKRGTGCFRPSDQLSSRSVPRSRP
jgi:putative tricarboxylic transport membrane protein